jgi:5-methylcytosine-specific restriction endonuclease McrA
MTESPEVQELKKELELYKKMMKTKDRHRGKNGDNPFYHMRQMSWLYLHEDIDKKSKCGICDRIISFDAKGSSDEAWDMAHIVSRNNHGHKSLDNTRAICAKCNPRGRGEESTIHMVAYILKKEKIGAKKVVDNAKEYMESVLLQVIDRFKKIHINIDDHKNMILLFLIGQTYREYTYESNDLGFFAEVFSEIFRDRTWRVDVELLKRIVSDKREFGECELFEGGEFGNFYDECKGKPIKTAKKERST